MKELALFYIGMIIIFAIYGAFWGDHAFQGFFWNLERSVFWPKIMFQGLWEMLKATLKYVVQAIFLLGFVYWIWSK